MHGDGELLAFLEKQDPIAQNPRAQARLVVGLGVHEVEEVSVSVQVLNLPTLQSDILEPLFRAEGPLHGGTRLKIAERAPHAGGPAADVGVLEVQNAVEGTLELNDGPLAEFVGGDHWVASTLWSALDARFASAAPTKSRNSGWGRCGRDLNSGWNCDPTIQG